MPNRPPSTATFVAPGSSSEIPPCASRPRRPHRNRRNKNSVPPERRSYQGKWVSRMINKRVLHFAAAGFTAAAAIQLLGFCLSSAQTQLPGLVLFNWLSLLLSPFSLLFRLANPEITSLGPVQLLVVISANSLCCAIGCRFLQITFARMSQKLQN